MKVTDLEITYDLALDETLTCDWFNVRADGASGGEASTPEPATTSETRPLSGSDQAAGDEATPDATVDHNGNGVFLTNDSDDDGLLDDDEINTYGTNPKNADTDSDGLSDFNEIMLDITNPLQGDTDGDGLLDGDEVKVRGTDPLNFDTDGDGVGDGDEVNAGTDPLKP
jgi:hypothetical protein